MNRTRRTWLLALVALTVLGLGTWTQATTPPSSAADDPEAALQAFVDAVNAGDSEAMLASFTDDGAWQTIDPAAGSSGFFGATALQFAFAGTAGVDVTVTSSEVSGSSISGAAEYSDGRTTSAGVERIIQPFVAEASEDKLASLTLHFDESDSQTAQFLQWERDNPTELPSPPPDTIELALSGNAPADAAIATVVPGLIVVFVAPATVPDAEKPVSIWSGTCDSLSDITQPLPPLAGPTSTGFLSMAIDDLTASPHALTISDSGAPDIVLSCADIEGTAATPTPTGGGSQLPNTGSGPSGRGDFGWPLAALVALGAAALAGSGALRLSLRRR